MPLKQQMQMLNEQCKSQSSLPSPCVSFVWLHTEYLQNIDIIQIFFSLSNNNQINITYKMMKRAYYIVSLPPY